MGKVETVTAEVINNSREFKWRLVIGEYSTHWTRTYSSILVIRSQETGKLYGYATDYWSGGGLPIEEPFMITQGVEQNYDKDRLQ